ncbi:DUF5693 family protein [Marinitoga aeolica]|uniref:Uncharacterized protein n=1 Tax=Marinitoga aeolica TaxID=2809031 RepID=A0ABY8PNT3_9BACT|nr:DUF5693 family protein [Marinitoga aeolica]WGS64193.1 hypothetical protein JRV97_07365 [Marinitoga aeolica]
MKKIKKYIFWISILYAVIVFIYISFNDYNYLKSGYHIIDNNNLKKQSIMIDNKVIEYYNYEGYALISENSTNIELDDFKKFIQKFDYIIVAEFSDFGYLFDKYKVFLSKKELMKIRYAHYIKPREMDKYNISQIVQRFWRAFNERRINIFYIPDHVKRNEIIKAIKKRMINYNEKIPVIKSPPINIRVISVAVISIYMLMISPAISLLNILLYIFLNSWSYVFIAIIFSFISWMKWKKYKQIFKIMLLNIMYGVLIYSTGYTYFYIYKISVIRGIKLLLVSLPFILFIVQIKNFKLKKKDIFLSAIFLGIIAVYYILRSGNFGFSTMFERNIRDFLEKALIARPRFKELFAYIFVFTKSPTIFFEIFWNIGQSILFVSILDTFLHFQTPLYLGVLRTINAYMLAFIIYRVISLIWRRKNGKRN